MDPHGEVGVPWDLGSLMSSLSTQHTLGLPEAALQVRLREARDGLTGGAGAPPSRACAPQLRPPSMQKPHFQEPTLLLALFPSLALSPLDGLVRELE